MAGKLCVNESEKKAKGMTHWLGDNRIGFWFDVVCCGSETGDGLLMRMEKGNLISGEVRLLHGAARARGSFEYYSNWFRTKPTNVNTFVLKFTLKNHPQSRDIINKKYFALAFFVFRHKFSTKNPYSVYLPRKMMEIRVGASLVLLNFERIRETASKMKNLLSFFFCFLAFLSTIAMKTQWTIQRNREERRKWKFNSNEYNSNFVN